MAVALALSYSSNESALIAEIIASVTSELRYEGTTVARRACAARLGAKAGAVRSGVDW